MLDPRGSGWTKWDLHVHTPASLVHQYPGSENEAWEAFLTDLEALPEEFTVLGVNDYWFLDGYERLLAEKESGRLSNISLLLPVVELRLNQFGGSESQLSRVNYHVIFSNDLSSQVIREQFLSGLSRSFNILPRHKGTALEGKWSGIVTRASLEALGAEIIESVPEGERPRYGSPMIEGFNNLTIPLETVEGLLASSSFLKGRYITAVGKTEWADIKWVDGSIADKKHVINGVDCIFTAAESVGSYQNGRRALATAGVSDRLLDCSDAHHLSTSQHKDRIGNTNQWIKSDPTFSGLLQAVEEFDQRVFVGDEPPQLRRVREHPSKYLDRVRITKRTDSGLAEPWFSTDLRLNAGLVAVIGNKGSGKSALAEVIGLVGGSPHEALFSFLAPAKFRNPRHRLASHFEGELTWYGEEARTFRLSDEVEPGTEARVQHLPQRYLESLCNELPTGEKTAFDEELERIIFDHLPLDQRLETQSLDALVGIITGSIDTELAEKRSHLADLNRDMASLEEDLEPEAAKARKTRYQGLRREWLALRRNAPQAVPEPDASDPARAEIRARVQGLTTAEGHLSGLQDKVEADLSAARRRQADLSSFRASLEKLKRDHDTLREQNRELGEALKLPDAVSVFTVDFTALDGTRTALASTIEALDHLNTGGPEDERGIQTGLEWLRQERTTQRQLLSAPEEAREAYLQALSEWDTEVRELLGHSESAGPDTLLGARKLHFHLRVVPTQLEAMRDRRRDLAREIHALLMKKAVECAGLYEPLQSYMDSRKLPEDYGLSVSTSLIDTGFSDRFLNELVNRQVSGSFSGVTESDQVVGAMLGGVDFDDVESVVAFVEGVDSHLRFNLNHDPPTECVLRKQVRKGVSVAALYDWIYGQQYLSPRYGLMFGGKPIYQLSPGEKGTLLLIFFLLAELDTRPLIIDQPEDNLDNNTVYRALVGCFQQAKTRRQVIIVTHNPNLAVVCDADQIVVAKMEKGESHQITYAAGAIERIDTIRAIVDILEGTQPAFRNRSVKYSLHMLD